MAIEKFDFNAVDGGSLSAAQFNKMTGVLNACVDILNALGAEQDPETGEVSLNIDQLAVADPSGNLALLMSKDTNGLRVNSIYTNSGAVDGNNNDLSE